MIIPFSNLVRPIASWFSTQEAAVAMVDSRCHSHDETSSSAAANCDIVSRFRVHSGSLKTKGFMGTAEFAVIDLTLPDRLTLDHDEAENREVRGVLSDDIKLMPRLRGRQGSPAASASKNPSTNSPNLNAAETPVERGRSRHRRCGSPSKKEIVLRGPVSPDRFIPSRQFACPPSTPFRVSKVPTQLTPEEKLRRRCPLSADPFMPSRPRRSVEDPRTQSQAERRHSPHYGPHLVNDSAAVGNHGDNETNGLLRQVSSGAVWNVGGSSAVLGRPPTAVPDGAGGLLGSGTTAPMYVAKFMKRSSQTDMHEKYESRVALALDIDRATRLLGTSTDWPLLDSKPSPSSPDYERFFPYSWKDNAWRRAEELQWPQPASKDHGEKEVVPSRPFRVLEAPRLQDDFYCTVLAYCSTSGILAVGLAHEVYLWSEDFGVHHPPFNHHRPSNYVTSLSFSSESGRKSILAVGHQSGLLTLWSTFESDSRFEVAHPSSVSCVAFKQTTTRRLSERCPNMAADVEDLAVGDEHGFVWYYSVEWPDHDSTWGGSMVLLAKISAHTQQICGLSWSPDGTYLATGGNDNTCLLFEICEIVPPAQLGEPPEPPPLQHRSSGCHNAFSCLAVNANPRRLFSRRNILSHLLPFWGNSDARPLSPSIFKQTGSFISGGGRTAIVSPNSHKHRFAHSAAVKAIAFAPWQPSLLATGGGSNDRAIHFFHTQSGACLATINVYAQVTSLIWSKTRPEIAATFGYAQPEHPIRIAVFTWPSCEQITAIPWGPRGSSVDGGINESTTDCGRALWAVSYPGCPYGLAADLHDQVDTSTEEGLSGRRRRRGSCQRKSALAVVRPKAKEGGLWCSRTLEEGCIIVASSDQTVKFHEVWGGPRKTAAAASGFLGGSDILEELEGIENPGKEIIR